MKNEIVENVVIVFGELGDDFQILCLFVRENYSDDNIMFWTSHDKLCLMVHGLHIKRYPKLKRKVIIIHLVPHEVVMHS